jgi:tRNA1(Val) A37 N6-methylase TrmN6
MAKSNNTKQYILEAIQNFEGKDFNIAGRELFEALGYNTRRRSPLSKNTFTHFEKTLDNQDYSMHKERALSSEWKYVDILFQLTEDEISSDVEGFAVEEVNNSIMESYLFICIELEGSEYSRSKLSQITREVNRATAMPTMVLFRYGKTITLSLINRRLHKRDDSKDVLEKVTLIKDISIQSPHRAHIDILEDLCLEKLAGKSAFTNFQELHEAWQKALDTKELNKRFYRDLSNWYFWALKKVKFPFALPNDSTASKDELHSIALIRFLTRIIFVWFLKEKRLIPSELFDENFIKQLVNDFSTKGTKTTYYTTILQNLFFGTLNTQRKNDASSEEISRQFRNPKRDPKGRTDDYMVTNLYRYESRLKDPNKLLELLKDVPFLNGGLFECLDKREGQNEQETRLDCFSDIDKKQPNFPDYLFFSDPSELDLSEDYGDKSRKKESVSGIIHLLNRYKFTIEENTPIDEEIALDPELLGKVFENLLASYNPETKETARKQTGSFYTPREIVNYMVEESLIAYYKNGLVGDSIGHSVLGSDENVMFPDAPISKKGQLSLTIPNVSAKWTGKETELEEKLRTLIKDGNEENPFSQEDSEALVHLTSNAKILDPACGSGAFPMGVLHKLVNVLQVLDPKNEKWKQEQINKTDWEKDEVIRRIDQDIELASKIHSEDVKKKALEELEEKKKSIQAHFQEQNPDYSRKLYLIENCIYGVDIQPIAVQISKLRFFISLIVDQKIDPSKKNLGIVPLPNLETKFVAANTLIGLEKPEEGALLTKNDPGLMKLEQDLKAIRKKYFYSRSRKEKLQLKKEDLRIRGEILQHFLEKNKSFVKDLEEKLKVGKLPKEQLKEIQDYIQNPKSTSVEELKKIVQTICKKSKIDAGIANVAVNTCSRYFPPASASAIAGWDPYDQNSHASWFDPEHMFGILPSGKDQVGFDIVIGNPPYGASIKGLSRKLTVNNLGHVPDFEIYYFFINASYKILKSNGINCYIIPNTILFNTFAKKYRLNILDLWHVNEIIDCTDIKLFDGATVFNIIYLFIKKKSENRKIGFKTSNEKKSINEILLQELKFTSKDSLIKNNLNWALEFKLEKGTKTIIQKIKNNSIECFKMLPEISQGLIAYDKHQGQDEYTIENRIYHHNKKSQKNLKKWLWGEDVTRYRVSWNGEEYIDYCSGLANPRDPKYFNGERILIREITNPRIFATFTKTELYNDPSLLIIKSGKEVDLLFFLGILNSHLASYFHFNHSPKATKGGFPKILIEDLKHFPITRSPIINPALQKPLIALVDKILAAKEKDAQADTSEWEAEIDARVFHLYGLNDEEMNTVLDSFPRMTAEEKGRIRDWYNGL